jgi:hypothetical protein
MIKITYPINNRTLILKFAARWRSIRKISPAQMTKNPRKITKTSNSQENSTPPYGKKKVETKRLRAKVTIFSSPN